MSDEDLDNYEYIGDGKRLCFVNIHTGHRVYHEDALFHVLKNRMLSNDGDSHNAVETKHVYTNIEDECPSLPIKETVETKVAPPPIPKMKDDESGDIPEGCEGGCALMILMIIIGGFALWMFYGVPFLGSLCE